MSKSAVFLNGFGTQMGISFSTHQQRKLMEKIKDFFSIGQLRPAGFGYEEEIENRKSDRHYKIIWVVNGSGTNWMDLEQASIANNTLYFIKPNQAHRFQAEADMKGYM